MGTNRMEHGRGEPGSPLPVGGKGWPRVSGIASSVWFWKHVTVLVWTRPTGESMDMPEARGSPAGFNVLVPRSYIYSLAAVTCRTRGNTSAILLRISTLDAALRISSPSL